MHEVLRNAYIHLDVIHENIEDFKIEKHLIHVHLFDLENYLHSNELAPWAYMYLLQTLYYYQSRADVGQDGSGDGMHQGRIEPVINVSHDHGLG